MDLKSHVVCSLLLSALYLKSAFARVRLRMSTVVYVPYDYKPEPKFSMFAEASEQIAHDYTNHITYTIGGSGYLHVIDHRTPHKAKILHHVHVPGVPNDIDTCGDYVAVTVRNIYQPLQGKVNIYSIYDFTTHTMEKVNEVPVGNSPASMITFTRSCRTILVANEGEAGKDENGKFVDLEGSISIIKFDTKDLSETPTVKTANFTKFNDRAQEYVKKGVRWVYKGQRSGKKTPFSTDLEPEYLALSPDEKLAYVVLQENNAMAKVDVEHGEVLEIYPLGFKDWRKYGGLDPSDKDGGIKIHPWPIFGIYQPDAVKLFVHNNVSYLVTANEGDKKDYSRKEHGLYWTEITRGKIFVKANLLAESVPADMERALRDDRQLGRLKMSLVEGRVGRKYKYDQFFAYGGRSFSIFRADDMQLVYDSGSEIERMHALLMPDVFNSHVGSLKHKPGQDQDDRSDDHGPEVEIVETATIGNKTYIFVGNQRVSTIIIYSVSGPTITPKFEGLHRGGGKDKTWLELFESRNIGDSDLQDMKYIPAERSPTGKPMLLVSGSLSGTLAAYEIVIDDQPAFQ